jgi:O-antigen/teichoic acid export membrane protein
MAATPRLARLSEVALRKHLIRLLGIASLAILVPAAVLTVLQQPLISLAYGSKYPHALDAFNVLVLGIVLYGFYMVLGNVWGTLGRPMVGAVACAFGTVTTVVLAFLLIPTLGLLGGGIAFAAGAGAQLLFVSLFTAWGLYSGARARVGHLPDEAMLA